MSATLSWGDDFVYAAHHLLCVHIRVAAALLVRRDVWSRNAAICIRLALLGRLLISDAPDELRKRFFHSENQWRKSQVDALEAAYREYVLPVVYRFLLLSDINVKKSELQGENLYAHLLLQNVTTGEDQWTLPVDEFFSGEVDETRLDERFDIAKSWRVEVLATAKNLRDRLENEVSTAADNEEARLTARCLLAHGVIVGLEKEVVNLEVSDRRQIEDMVSDNRFSPEQLELVEADLTPAEECLVLELAVPIFQGLLAKLDLD
jgi:hypothetical protein